MEEFLSSLAIDRDASVVHDLGANDGHFSRIATRLGFSVVSQDIDPVAVEKNYLQTKSNQEENLLPLLLDLTNPSPAKPLPRRSRVEGSGTAVDVTTKSSMYISL